MTQHSPAAPPAFTPVPAARLEPDAIGVAQDTVIGMASSAPAVSAGITLAALAAATAYGSGPVIVATALPMLVIANAYQRLNMWNANCGASFEWVGRAISPYLGFLTGWLMIAGYLIGAVAGVEIIGPAVLAVFSSTFASTWASIWIATGGHGSLPAGLLLAVFIFSGWEGTLYVNEEVRHRRVNPGRAAITAVVLLTILYTLAAMGLQGTVPPAQLQAHSTSALTYTAQALAGPTWAKVMALSLALSVIAATGTNIVLTARIIYGMASYRTLHPSLADISPRLATPAPASILTGILPVAAAGFLSWIIARSVQSAPPPQIWSLADVAAAGLALMLAARFALHSPFFHLPRESDHPRH